MASPRPRRQTNEHGRQTDEQTIRSTSPLPKAAIFAAGAQLDCQMISMHKLFLVIVDLTSYRLRVYWYVLTIYIDCLADIVLKFVK